VASGGWREGTEQAAPQLPQRLSSYSVRGSSSQCSSQSANSARVPSKRRRNCPSASHRILFVAHRANVRPKVPTPTEQ
jgi:hypothetical protein